MRNPYLRDPKWPPWKDVIAFWNTLGVPDVEVWPWPPERPHVAPWDRRDNYSRGNSWYPTSSPQDQTAYHIACTLPGLPPESRAAFKLEACCRELGLTDFMGNVVFRANRKAKVVEYGWWHPNAKNVLPNAFYDGWLRPRTPWDTARNWKGIIDQSAKIWTDLASDWVVVRVPEFMDPESEEYKAHRERMTIAHHARERAEYERLREKFERRGRGGEMLEDNPIG
jgi:hypothetical protein